MPDKTSSSPAAPNTEPLVRTVVINGETLNLKSYVSETARYPGFREMMQPYCTGYGLDIGFGGDPINPTAIRMDLPQPYVYAGDLPVQLGGDCRDLYWFRDGVLDFLYSSHVLEDFDAPETELVLAEWARVLKPGGHLALLLPDQQRYVQHCRAQGERENDHHSIAHFSMAYVQEVAQRVGALETVLEQPEVGPYSFAVVFRKMTSDTEAAQIDLHAHLQQAWAERDALIVKLRGAERAVEVKQRREEEAERELQRLRQLPVIRMGQSLARFKRKLFGSRSR